MGNLRLPSADEYGTGTVLVSLPLSSFLEDTFSNHGFMPHVHCYLDKPLLVWTMVCTDMLIGLSYVAISLTLYRLVRHIKLPFSMVFLAFGLFIAACGATHFMDVYNLWVPDYWYAAFVKVVTAAASVSTAVWLLHLRPAIVGFAEAALATGESRRMLMEKAQDLERVNAAQKIAEAALRQARDETEKRVEERTASLIETSDRLEDALSAAQLGTWDWDLRTGIFEWSNTLKALFGFGPGDYDNSYAMFVSRLHPDDRAMVEAALKSCIDGQDPYDLEYRVAWPDGSVHWLAAQGRLARDAQGAALRMFGTALNIDMKRRSQEELERLVESRTRQLADAQAVLAHAGKLSALGEMAAGIAHEINTPLAAIAMKSHQMRRRLAQHSASIVDYQTIMQDADVIADTTKRIADIIQGLRVFARDGEADAFEHGYVREMIDHVLALCQSRFKNHNITLRYDPQSYDVLTVECRIVQIEQILLSLLNNAFDAVESLADKWVAIDVVENAGSIVFSVTDSGRGIPASVAEKMMQPFFTTKEPGRGTGLGLSISRGIAEAHHGELSLDVRRANTCMVLSLPKTRLGENTHER